MSDHLWYLGSELVVLSLFSEKVADAEKHLLFEKMKKMDNGEWNQRNVRLIGTKDISNKHLHHLVDSSSMTVLRSFKLQIDFMWEHDVTDWKNLESYKSAKQIIDSLQVVKDSAERSLKLMTDFNDSLTTDESEM